MLWNHRRSAKAIADINYYPGWKASVYYIRRKIKENWEGQTDANILTEEKNRKKYPTLSPETWRQWWRNNSNT